MNVKINLDEFEHFLDEIESTLQSAGVPDCNIDSHPRSFTLTSFSSSFSLSNCLRFHRSADTGQYVLEELIAMDDPNLEFNMNAFCFLLSESPQPVEEAAFAACFDFFMDLIRRDSRLNTPREYRESLELREEISREILIQAVASRRPSMKFTKFEQALRVLSERSDSTNADDLLQSLARILPSVPLIRETVTLMRTYLDIRDDPDLLVGPVGYALTSLETVLGIL